MSRRGNQQRNRGVYRDKRGIVLSRKDRHPLADVFTAIPASSSDYPEAQLPPINIPEEVKHLAAIHIFDNLKCSPPGEDALYRLVTPLSGHDYPMGGGNQIWLPHDVDVAEVMPGPVDPTDVPDVGEFSDAQLNALQAKIDDLKLARSANEGLDKPREAPEFARYTERRMDELAARLDAGRPAEGEQ